MPSFAHELKHELPTKAFRASHLHVDRAEGDVVGFEQFDLVAQGEAGYVFADDLAATSPCQEIFDDALVAAKTTIRL